MEKGVHMNWKGKTAIVTGASGGIGSAICEKLASLQINQVITGRKMEVLEKLAAEANGTGVEVMACAGDITDSAFRKSLVQNAVERFGSLDVVINCAGIAQNQHFEEVTEEDYDRIMNLNAKAPYFLCQAALPELRKSSCATIINITSVVAHKGYPFQSAYAASKHALAGFSKSLANEVYKENIRVHLISPGGVYTPMVALARPDLTPDMVSLPEDIANIAAFYLEMRDANAIVDEIQVHRSGKEPFA